MKKFLQLLLLPSLVFAQDSESLQIKKPRKLFVEIKQGGGLTVCWHKIQKPKRQLLEYGVELLFN